MEQHHDVHHAPISRAGVWGDRLVMDVEQRQLARHGMHQVPRRHEAVNIDVILVVVNGRGRWMPARSSEVEVQQEIGGARARHLAERTTCRKLA